MTATSMRGAPVAATAASAPLVLAWQIVRLAVATTMILALALQLRRTIVTAAAEPEPYASHLPTVIGNYFSFFTNQTSIAGVVVLIVAAVSALRRLRSGQTHADGSVLATVLVAVSTYEFVTGSVYAALLRGNGYSAASLPWANEMLHVVAPLFFVVDLLVAPGRRVLPWRRAWLVVMYPLAWMAFTLIRGFAVVSVDTGTSPWFPYPFLDPAEQGGWTGVLIYIVALAAVVVVLAFGVIATARLPWVRALSAPGS